MINSEPSASTKPKLTANRKIELVEVRLNGSATLMCPVQAYPVALSRWGFSDLSPYDLSV